MANLSPRERTDDTAILSCLTKGYPRTRMKDKEKDFREEKQDDELEVPGNNKFVRLN